MGIAVRNSAYSPNIKERLDHSCALFDAQWTADRASRAHSRAPGLASVGLAPHAARASSASTASDAPGRTVGRQRSVHLRNALNDVTRDAADLSSTARSSATPPTRRTTPTSAESVPGSMPADARDIFAEGFVMPPMRLMRGRRASLTRRSRCSGRTRARRDDAQRRSCGRKLAGNYTGERRLLRNLRPLRRGDDLRGRRRKLDRQQRTADARRAARARDGVFEARDVDGGPRRAADDLVIALRLELRDGHARARL